MQGGAQPGDGKPEEIRSGIGEPAEIRSEARGKQDYGYAEIHFRAGVKTHRSSD